MHVHFVAVAGTGMGALAGLFRSLGHRVTGSDVSFYPPMGPALERWGIELRTGFDPAHLEPRPDLVVIGNVCRRDNPEARAAIDGGMRYLSMAHALAEHVLEGTSPLVVGGTHGKTTTSTLAAFLLARAGREPGFLLGGIPRDFDESFRAPRAAQGAGRLPVVGPAGQALRGPPFVVEGDEYDTAFFEKTPKFWHYRPEVAIVTSLEHDHIDIYPTAQSYRAAFEGFVERLPEHGLVVACASDALVVEVVRERARCEIAWFALEGEELHGQAPHWLVAPVATDASGQSFDLYVGGVSAKRAATRLWGRHNLRNVAAALGAVCQGFGVPVDVALSALAEFRGVRRRQEVRYEVGGVRVIDDFAHHPTAVRETLAALRAAHGEARLFVAFEPRSATACRALHQRDYESAFDDADRVLLAPIGRPDLPVDERLDTERLARALTDRGTPSHAQGSVAEIVATLVAETRSGDVVALLSNGAFGGIYDALEQALRERASREVAS
jgi:UDP-N-acetylmuramate: L-alanyl-gamma-D-glutamyl-meso-diaminopimelate ligase